ncbi:hypothetical protein [Nostoc piscinale]|uniref:competence protein CoiA family protein n=1 Tax=Nostoc piscinale TaxID=224012 RepID=UPI000A49798F|nr:hypothetical protein [Nostoc piscinale]
MEYAISIYKPGERVYPEQCDFNSYFDLYLLCPECKQEVYLRNGNFIKPYFAHFHATNSRKVKPCSLRVSSDENAIDTSKIIEDRGQRLKIIQQHILSMLYIGKEKLVDDISFSYWFNSIKNDNNPTINKIIDNCIEYFIKNRQLVEDKYITHPAKTTNKHIRLQQQIALEVMNYLCANAKYNFHLRHLLYYSIYKLYKHEQHKLFEQIFLTKHIDEICQYTAKIILLNPWISAFHKLEINNSNNKTQPNIIKIYKNKSLTKPIESPIQLPIPFNCYGGKTLDQVMRYTLEVTSTKPFKVTIYFHSVRSRKGELINNKLEVMSIEAGIGILKPTFNNLPLEDKMVFSSQVDGEETTFNFHYEVVSLLALPYWIDNASQYVRLNQLAPVWLVVSKLWVKATYEENSAKSIEETLQVKPFTETQWWESIIESANLLPNCMQLQNALKSIPVTYQHLLKSLNAQSTTSLTVSFKEGYPDLCKTQELKSEQQLAKIEQVKTVVNTFKSGLIDNWSFPFQVTLQNGDYLYNANCPKMTLQLCLEQEKLVLYKLGKGYTRLFENETSTKNGITVLAGQSVGQVQNLNMIQDRTKLLTIGTLSVEQFDVWEWIATQPRYESIAKEMNKRRVLSLATIQQYNGIQTSNNTVTVGDRILAKRVFIGKQPLIHVNMLTKYKVNGEVLPEYHWLYQLCKIASRKMISNNAREVEHKLKSNELVAEDHDKLTKAKHNIKTLLRTINKTIKQFTKLGDKETVELSNIIAEYLMCKLGMTRYEVVGVIQNLDEQKFIELRDKAKANHNSKGIAMSEAQDLRQHHLPKYNYQLDEPVWLVTTTKNGEQKSKHWIVKRLNRNYYQIRDKKGFKFPVSVTMLRPFT